MDTFWSAMLCELAWNPIYACEIVKFLMSIINLRIRRISRRKKKMERERLSKAIQGLRDAFHDLRRQYVMLESRSERHISERLGVSHAVQEAVGMEHFF